MKEQTTMQLGMIGLGRMGAAATLITPTDCFPRCALDSVVTSRSNKLKQLEFYDSTDGTSDH